jgi:hypothetical protein
LNVFYLSIHLASDTTVPLIVVTARLIPQTMSKLEQRVLCVKRLILQARRHSFVTPREVKRQLSFRLRAIFTEHHIQERLRAASVCRKQRGRTFCDLWDCCGPVKVDVDYSRDSRLPDWRSVPFSMGSEGAIGALRRSRA